MNLKPNNVFSDIKNTLAILDNNNLTLYSNTPLYQTFRNESIITWPNHKPARANCSPYFGQIAQYRYIIETDAFTCLLYDGAIIRVSYAFKNGKLSQYNLLWWPSPFKITSEDLQIGAILDIFDLYASGNNWHNEIRMRSPVRFDYDASNISFEHPSSHIHLQDPDCRIYVDRIVCFNRFIKFIFQNFYPNKFKSHVFWNDLNYLSMEDELCLGLLTKQVYMGWHS